MNSLDLAAYIFLFVAVIVIGVLPVFLVWHSWKMIGWLRPDRNEIIDAHIKQKEIDSGGEGTVYLISYAFSVDGKHYQRKCQVSKRKYDQVNVGTSIKIVYNKNNPLISKLYYSRLRFTAQIIVILAVEIYLLVGIIQGIISALT